MRQVERRRLALLAVLAATPAFAGPLADWVKERRAAKDELEEDVDDAPSRRRFDPPAGIKVDRDIAYGPDPAQKLDVYRSEKGSTGAPVILMVHGGGWRRGDKGGPSMVDSKVSHWVGRGWVLVSLNYRLVPKATPVQQADDIGRALAFVQGRASEWGADPARCVLMGHSAGAHLVALVSSDAAIASRQGAKPWAGTIAIDSAAYDVVAIMNRRHYGLYDTAFGSDPKLWRDASPLHRLDGKPAAPMLLVCSSRRDDACPPAQEFADKANRAGGKVVVLPVKLNHAKINSDLGKRNEYTESVDSFFRSVGLQ